MKRTKKKMLSLILTVCMVLSLLPTFRVGAAAVDITTRTTTLDFTNSETTPAWQTGCTQDTTTTTLWTNTAEGWSYDTAAKKLTLSGATINVTSGGAIKLPEGATIVVMSDSTAATSDSAATAVKGVGALTITGSGKFTVTGTGEYKNSTNTGSNGIETVGNLTLTNANIDAKGTEGGIYSDKDILIYGGTVIANATGEFKDSHEPVAIEAMGSITIKNANVTASATGNSKYAAIVWGDDGSLNLDSASITDPSNGVSGVYEDYGINTILNGAKIATSVTIAAGSAVTFDFSGVIENTTTTTVTVKSGSVALPTVPSEYTINYDLFSSKYTFGGWYTDKTYTTQWASPEDSTKSADSTMTVYAKWTNAAGKIVRSTALDFTDTTAWQTGCTKDETTTTLWKNESEGWSYDTSTKTLTLTDASICTTTSPSIKLPANATIVLAGTRENEVVPSNYLYLRNSSVNTSAAYGIDCEGDLTIQGTGSLFARSAPSTVMCCGIHSAGSIGVTGGSKVLAHGLYGAASGNNELVSAGIYAEKNITVSGSASELYAFATICDNYINNYSIGSYSKETTTVNDGALFVASGRMAVCSVGTLKLGEDVKMPSSSASSMSLESASTGEWNGTAYNSSTLTAATPAGYTILSSASPAQPASAAIVNFGSAAISSESSSGTTVSGTSGVALPGTDTATITLTGNKFNAVAANTQIGFDNLKGVNVYAATAILAGATEAQVTFSGTPVRASKAPILVTIDPKYLSRGKYLSSWAIPLITTANPVVKWNITQGKVKRTTTLDLTGTSVTYTNASGNTEASADPTAAAITDTNEGWAWYPAASTSYDAAKAITADNHPAKTLLFSGADIETTDAKGVIVPDGSTVVLADGTVNTIKSGNNLYSIALECYTDGKYTDGLTISGSGTLNATAGTADGSDSAYNSLGIYVGGPVVINSGVINATGGESKNNSAGIASEKSSITINGGTVNAVGGKMTSKTADNSSVGLAAGKNVTVNGGSVTANGDTTGTGAYSAGILALGDTAAFNGGTTNAAGSTAAVAAKNGVTVNSAVAVTSPTNGKVGGYENYKTILNGTTPATAVTITKKTDSGSGSGSNSGSSSTTTKPGTTTTSTVVVDGKTTDAGKVTTKTNTDGTKTTTVAVDTTKLNAQVAAADKGSSVQVTVPTTTGTASAQLVVKDVENLSQKDMSLEIKTGDTTYTVAPNAIDTAKVASELGATDTSKVPLTVTVTPVKQSDVTVAKGTQVADPVKFEVTASYDGKSVAVSTFNSYVERAITISANVDPNKITTGIRVDDGEQVPTFVTKNADGTCTAKVNSLTNSTYAIIYNEASFSDTVGKWYNDIVTEMASRTIVNGKTSTTFDGDGYITRAEYAAILVRALGIPEGGTSSFTDISSSDWYYGAVGAAVKYGIITGYDDGTFRPNANISRQEAMAMLQRAAKVAEYAGTTGTLTSFTDADQVAAWAQTAAQFNVGSGLIVGSDGTIRPTDSITRAEAATVVLRLLQKSGLVDIRSKT